MVFNRRVAAALAMALMLAPISAVAQQRVTVFAAASLTDSLKQVADLYKARTGKEVVLSFGASSTLARQIEQGAAADMFFSADTDWMDYLAKGGHIARASRKNLLGNRLVLVAAPDAKSPPRIAPNFDLAGALGERRLALADPASVPAGKYAKAALTALGIWDSVANKVANAENVRVALEYVARGEAPYGIVYATDAKVAPQVRIVGIFPETTHPPIIYPVALTTGAGPEARSFLEFLAGAQARAVFAKAGFSPL
jgi:molybdate transport system substrate-binding protein